MTSFKDAQRADLRLTVLHLLDSTDGYALSDRLLRSALESFGHRPSLDALRAELAWLAEQGLVTTQDVEGHTMATLTARGQDVAQGRARVPGVRRPEPTP